MEDIHIAVKNVAIQGIFSNNFNNEYLENREYDSNGCYRYHCGDTYDLEG